MWLLALLVLTNKTYLFILVHMSDHHSKPDSAIEILAEKVVQDIQLRRLLPGQRYLTSEEARHLFGVGKRTMDQALQSLVEREILIRRQKVGTFIGPNTPLREDIRSKTFCILLGMHASALAHFPVESLVESFRTESPGSHVQFNVVAESGDLPYVKEVLTTASATGSLGGVLALACPYDVTDFLVNARIPSVIFGPLPATRWSTPCVDLDRRQAGLLLTQYLVDRGHRRMALLDCVAGRVCNNRFCDGVSDVLTAAGLPPNALLDRVLPIDVDLVAVAIRELLEMETPPTAVMATSHRLAEMVATAVSRSNRTADRDVEIVFWDHATPVTQASPYAHVQPTLSFEETAATLARMLRDVLEGKPLEREQIVIPVELCEGAAGRLQPGKLRG